MPLSGISKNILISHFWKTPAINAIESMKITSMETVSTGVRDQNKELYLRRKYKAEKAYDVSRHIRLRMSKYKKWRFTIQYVKPTAQLFFKIWFPKKLDQHKGGKWLIHDAKRRKDDQFQSLKLHCRISKLSS